MNVRIAALACTALIALQPAFAHAAETQGGAEPAAGIADIVVTARRTQERLQDVPVAVTGYDQVQLKALDIKGFGDIGKTVPNLDVQRQFGSANAPQYYLRGVSTGTLKFEADAGIGLYIDGIYLGRPAGTAFSLADIERVEVLRGPQGTLFGRNSTGGAINFVTSAPKGEFGVKAEGTVGNYDRYKGQVVVNLPAFGPFSARVSYLHDQNKGYVKNLTPGRTFNFVEPFGTIRSAKTFGAENTDAVAVAVRFQEGALTADYKFDYTDKVSTQLAQQLLGYDPGYAAGVGNPPFYAASPSIYVPASTERQGAIALDFTSPSHMKIQGHSLTLAFDVSDAITLKSITGLRKLDEFVGGNDIDGGAYEVGGLPFTNISSIQDRHQKQFTQELQVLGKMGNLDWVLGGFYFRETGKDDNPVFIGTLFPTFAPQIVPVVDATTGNTLNIFGVPTDYFAGSNAKIRNKSVAGYGHVSYKTDRFELAGGVRYTKDDRFEDLLAGGIIPLYAPAKQSSVSFDHWDFDATATWIANADVRAYARFATGYLSGGVLGGKVFKPETVNSYEVGVKADLIDKTLRINAAGFITRRKNVQTLGFDVASGTFLFSSPFGNEEGFEVELTAKPSANFTFNASYGYLHQKLAADPVNGPVNSLAPKNTLSVGAQYDSPAFANGSYVSLRLDGFFKDKRLSDPISNAATLQLTTLPSRFDINARFSLMEIPLGGSKANVAVWAQNLTNNRKLDFARNLTTNVIGVFQVPRTWGVDVGFAF
ncbi:TonB-dependent receptor, plug (plasmid) [Novosphingobium aromaticivorans DSM 12444]|uniref:TonB-dependent receptor, plug n=1 Tax=Novosphingobium aromaticivorans (strain ATCC 700278 / DSM 12444 / CCUG 56034 / CIP 105152 / NBRC 16084 / F199) TaxID=279238 RepID=A4XF73_NOVAD|nr:TonB-dependent receptor [Novosphingobium aromaticivorans]ABP64584.1 TonB-dependent receptor, plug [Novosphingobium aromaticivorans DSM 12444]SCY95130.1 iron complex outermembrane recepter protein [Novosphingobium aromaticivorans]